MATYLPDKLNFTEYQPVMQGIPVAQANAAYDRMDRNYIMAEQDATALEQGLATAAAKAAPGDREAILSRLNQVKDFVNTASEAGDLYNSVRQVKSLVRQVAGDEDYQLMSENARRYEQFRTQYNQLVTQHGANNVTVEGDGEEFSSIDPVTGERRQFMGAPSQLPDFDTTQKNIWEKNTDYVGSYETVQQFVNSGGAFNAYLGTPEGRTELDYVARQGFGIPYTRLSEEQQMAVNDVINNKLMSAGFRMVKTAQAKNNAQWDTDMYKDAAGVMITSSGVYGNTYSRNIYTPDGIMVDEDGEPVYETSTITSFNDGLSLSKSPLQRQLLGLIESDNNVDFYKLGEGGHFEPSEQALNLNDVDHIRLTTAIGVNGRPLAEVRMAGNPEDPKDRTPQVRYVEIQDKDMDLVRDAGKVFMAQLRENTPPQQQQAAMPMVASLYPQVTNWLVNGGSGTTLAIPGTPILVKKQDGVFLFQDPTGTYPRINGYEAKTDMEVRTKIGAVILGSQTN